VIIGALLGAGVTLFLIPSSRRALLRRFSEWLPDEDGELLEFDGIAQEAGASEGGLAATRTWRAGYPASQ
jgi:hypothetical protein